MSVPRPRLSGLDLSDSALLAGALHEAPIGFAFIGLDMRIRRVNQTMARLAGREQADSVGSTPEQAWPPDLAAAAEAAVRQVAAGERPAPQTEHRWPVVPVQGRSKDETGSGAPASHCAAAR